MKPLALAIPSFERRIPRDENWLAERGGLETAVSREDFPKENTRERWAISGRNRLASSRE
jgi:hypothetical protein